MFKADKKRATSDVEIQPWSDVQNERIGLGRIGSDSGGLPMKAAIFTCEKGPKSFNFDLRLHYSSIIQFQHCAYSLTTLLTQAVVS